MEREPQLAAVQRHELGALAAHDHVARRAGGRPSRLRVESGNSACWCPQVGHVGLVARGERVGDPLRHHLVDDRQLAAEHVLRRPEDLLGVEVAELVGVEAGQELLAPAPSPPPGDRRLAAEPRLHDRLVEQPSATGELISALTDIPPADCRRW